VCICFQGMASESMSDEDVASSVGADVLTQTPEIKAWLATLLPDQVTLTNRLYLIWRVQHRTDHFRY
jgi:hypothetical protein